jgi:hypothetical protein
MDPYCCFITEEGNSVQKKKYNNYYSVCLDAPLTPGAFDGLTQATATNSGLQNLSYLCSRKVAYIACKSKTNFLNLIPIFKKKIYKRFSRNTFDPSKYEVH